VFKALGTAAMRATSDSAFGIDCQKHRSFTIKNICIALNAERLVKEVNLQTANMAL